MPSTQSETPDNTPTLHPTIIETNDYHLRQLIFEHERVVVKFVDEECPVCKELTPSFERVSADPAYSSITFVRMSASENPVSRREVKLSGTPFFATYRSSVLQECCLVKSEAEMLALLDQLLSSN